MALQYSEAVVGGLLLCMQDVDEELHDVWFEKVPELDIASVVPAPVNDGCLVLGSPAARKTDIWCVMRSSVPAPEAGSAN